VLRWDMTSMVKRL